MNANADSSGSSSPPGENGGDFDPMVANLFRVLERVTPPDVTELQVPVASSLDSAPRPSRSGFLLAVAACVGLVVVGIAALVALTNGDGANGADVVDVAGEAPAESDSNDDARTDDGTDADVTAPLVVDDAPTPDQPPARNPMMAKRPPTAADPSPTGPTARPATAPSSPCRPLTMIRPGARRPPRPPTSSARILKPTATPVRPRRSRFGARSPR